MDSTDRDAIRRFINHLHRGGKWAHLWTDNGNRSHWFRADEPESRRIPRSWLGSNIYFTVNPLSDVPTSNASGNTNRSYIGSRYEYVCALNTLYAEYDGKDYVQPGEYDTANEDGKAAREAAFYQNPDLYNARALNVIQALPHRPSICVHSGGGYHCYWLLTDTVPLEDDNRDDAQATQYGWVQMVGADPGVSDLRRILRLPGTRNHKSGFANAPLVHLIWADFNCLYDFAELEEIVSDWLFENRPQRQKRAHSNTENAGDDVRACFNTTYTHDDILSRHGYTLCYQTPAFCRYARPGKDRHTPSVTVWPADDATGTPALSVHFSSNDPLYSQEYTDPDTGRAKRQGHDAYYLFAQLEHTGDWKAAYMAAKKAVGLWEERPATVEAKASMFIATAVQGAV